MPWFCLFLGTLFWFYLNLRHCNFYQIAMPKTPNNTLCAVQPWNWLLLDITWCQKWEPKWLASTRGAAAGTSKAPTGALYTQSSPQWSWVLGVSLLGSEPPNMVKVLSLYLGVLCCWLYLGRELFILVSTQLWGVGFLQALPPSRTPDQFMSKTYGPSSSKFLSHWTKITHNNLKLCWSTCGSFKISKLVCVLNWRKAIEQDKENGKHISIGILRPPIVIMNPLLLLPPEKLTLKKFPN